MRERQKGDNSRERQDGNEEAENEMEDLDEEEELDPETRLAHFEAELVLKFFNDRRELLERIITNLQEVIDGKNFTTATAKPQVDLQPLHNRIQRKDADGKTQISSNSFSFTMAILADTAASSAVTSKECPPAIQIDSATNSSTMSQTSVPHLTRISELQESEVLNSDSALQKNEDKENERYLKMLILSRELTLFKIEEEEFNPA